MHHHIQCLGRHQTAFSHFHSLGSLVDSACIIDTVKLLMRLIVESEAIRICKTGTSVRSHRYRPDRGVEVLTEDTKLVHFHKFAAGAMAGATRKPLPLKSVNHVSRKCRDLRASLAFYEHVLGFAPVKRPGSFNFDGAWLHNYGIGIHLLQIDNKELGTVPPVKKEINPRDDHISFQCEDILLVQAMLQENGIKWTHRVITEGGVEVEQVFFHDPDDFMIEICTCEKLPVQPLVRSTLVRYLSGKCNHTSNNSLDDLDALSLQLLQASDPPLQGVMDTISSSNACVVCA